MDKKVATGLAKMNDHLRRRMPLGQLRVELSPLVSTSPDRVQIIKAVRTQKEFDPNVDVQGDHSIGIVLLKGSAYLFRFTYGDKRYDYVSEIGQRTLSIMHLSEFRSLKFGSKVQAHVEKILETEGTPDA